MIVIATMTQTSIEFQNKAFDIGHYSRDDGSDRCHAAESDPHQTFGA